VGRVHRGARPVIRLLLALLLLVPVTASAAPKKKAEAEANRLLNRAMQELGRYQLDAGLATLGEVLALTPNDGFAHSRLAEIHAVGYGRGTELVATYRAVAAARPDEPIRTVWTVRAELARHVEDKWVVADRPWVQESLEALGSLTSHEDAEVRYAAWIAVRDLRMRLQDGAGAAAAGAAAIDLFPHRLQSRVSALLAARDAGDAARFQRICGDVIRDTPGAVEACSMLFSGGLWEDADALLKARADVLADVEKLGRRVLSDVVLAHEVAKFYGRRGLDAALQTAYVARILGRHPGFTLSPSSRWWLGRPPPLKTTQRRIREALPGDDVAPLSATDAPWAHEQAAVQAAQEGRHDDAVASIRRAREALTKLPWSPHATRPSTSFEAWSAARARDEGRMLGIEARSLRAAGRDDEAWPLAQRAAWLHGDGRTWIELAQFAAARGDAVLALEADLEGLSRLDGEAVTELPMEYRDRAVGRFLDAHPALGDPDLGWLALLSAAAGRRSLRAAGEAPDAPGAKEQHPFVGRPAPPFDVTTFAGTALSSESLRGKVVVVDFWATWCAPCKRAMPELQQAQDELGDDVVVLALSVDQRPEEAEQFMAASTYTFEAAHVGPDAQGPWEVRGIPSTFVIDANGVVRHHHQGWSRGVGRRIQGEVRALLAR